MRRRCQAAHANNTTGSMMVEVLLKRARRKQIRAAEYQRGFMAGEEVLGVRACPPMLCCQGAKGKRQRAAALQNLAEFGVLSTTRQRPGVRLPSAAFVVASERGLTSSTSCCCFSECPSSSRRRVEASYFR